MQGDQRVDPGRLNTAPRTVGLLTLDDPTLRLAEGIAAKELDRPELVVVQRAVEEVEATGPRRERVAGRRSRAEVELVDVDRELAYRSVGVHDGEGNHRLAGPTPEVVDVERNPGRQQHELGQEDGQFLPRPLAEERQPHAGEDPARADPAFSTDVVQGQLHVGVRRSVAGQLERHVRLDRRRKVRRTPVVGRPRSVVTLAGADPARGRQRLALGADPEELSQEEILRIHRHVGLELALPPAVFVLTLLEGGDGALEAVGGGTVPRDRPPAAKGDPNGIPVVTLGGVGSEERGERHQLSRSVTNLAMATSSLFGPGASATRSSAASAAVRCASARAVVSSLAPALLEQDPCPFHVGG